MQASAARKSPLGWQATNTRCGAFALIDATAIWSSVSPLAKSNSPTAACTRPQSTRVHHSPNRLGSPICKYINAAARLVRNWMRTSIVKQAVPGSPRRRLSYRVWLVLGLRPCYFSRSTKLGHWKRCGLSESKSRLTGATGRLDIPPVTCKKGTKQPDLELAFRADALLCDW